MDDLSIDLNAHEHRRPVFRHLVREDRLGSLRGELIFLRRRSLPRSGNRNFPVGGLPREIEPKAIRSLQDG